jgi:hypothetical protein
MDETEAEIDDAMGRLAARVQTVRIEVENIGPFSVFDPHPRLWENRWALLFVMFGGDLVSFSMEARGFELGKLVVKSYEYHKGKPGIKTRFDFEPQRPFSPGEFLAIIRQEGRLRYQLGNAGEDGRYWT